MKGRRIFRLGLVVLAAVLLALAGCRSAAPPTVSYFPVQKEPAEIILLASLPGELVLDEDGYLRAGDNIILWPYGYSYEVRDGEIWIIDEAGRDAARVGDSVRIEGGQIPADFAEEKLGYPLPEGCTGPFWLAGEIEEWVQPD
jgi:hypothetical protein